MYLKTQEALEEVKTLAKMVLGYHTKNHKALIAAVAKLEKALKAEEADRDACRGLGSD